MEMRTCGSIRRKRQVIDISPGPNKYRGVERAPVLHRALSSAHGVYRAQQRSIEPHCHEDRNGVEGHVGAGVAEVERIVGSLQRRHIDVHPLNGLVSRIVDRVGMPHAAGSPGRSLYLRRTPVDGELRLAVKNYEHLFALGMAVMADTAV